mmetsp:Transcript_46089/g.76795  ORF Transcript_46089/g.76795 Transcript_46089/m.76795 type:complete len:246 (+) Transcript_46089:175-912(+)
MSDVKLHHSMRGIPYTRAMHHYFQDHQYREPGRDAFLPPGRNYSCLRDDAQRPPFEEGSQYAWDGNPSLRSNVGCLPLTMQSAKPAWPSWAVCGHQPMPVSSQGKFESTMDEKRSREAGLQGPGYPKEGENWLASPPPTTAWKFDDTVGLISPTKYPFSTLSSREKSPARPRYMGAQDQKVMTREFEREGQRLGGANSSVEYKPSRKEPSEHVPNSPGPASYYNMPKASTRRQEPRYEHTGYSWR